MNVYPINQDKLRDELTKRGLTLAEVSKAMGRGVSFLNHHLSEGYTNKPTIVLLEKLFNISYSDYKADEPEETIKPTSTIDYEQLYKVIYSAVYEAVKKAWAE